VGRAQLHRVAGRKSLRTVSTPPSFTLKTVPAL
jgi:hypothetical protein